MSISIRPASRADIPALMVIQRQVQQLHVEWAPSRYRVVSDDALEAFMRSCLDGNNWHVLVAEDGGKIIGYLIIEMREAMLTPFTVHEKTAWMDQLAVDETARRNGVGAALVAAAEDLARREGCREMILQVVEPNQGAQAMYAAAGYETVSRRMAKAL